MLDKNNLSDYQGNIYGSHEIEYELHRTGKRYGLITMCIGGGQGIAAIIERM